MSASITRDMLDTGTSANDAIEPSGWSGNGRLFNEARGHLLATRLGGDGGLEENLVTLTQDPVNSPIMRDDVEAPIYNAVAAGESVQFTARAVYETAGDVAPSGLQIDAYGSQGFSLSRFIPNPAGMFGEG